MVFLATHNRPANGYKNDDSTSTDEVHWHGITINRERINQS